MFARLWISRGFQMDVAYCQVRLTVVWRIPQAFLQIRKRLLGIPGPIEGRTKPKVVALRRDIILPFKMQGARYTVRIFQLQQIRLQYIGGRDFLVDLMRETVFVDEDQKRQRERRSKIEKIHAEEAIQGRDVRRHLSQVNRLKRDSTGPVRFRPREQAKDRRPFAGFG